jgi:hypothetical protein
LERLSTREFYRRFSRSLLRPNSFGSQPSASRPISAIEVSSTAGLERTLPATTLEVRETFGLGMASTHIDPMPILAPPQLFALHGDDDLAYGEP